MILMLAMLLATAADAQTAPSPAPQQARSDEMVCRFIEKTGSRLARAKRCMTRAEWDEVSKDGSDYVRNLKDRSNLPGATGSTRP